MKRCLRAGTLFGWILLCAGTGFLIVEILQRHRFETRESRLKAALAEFKAQCSLAMTERFEPILAAEGSQNSGRVQIRDDCEDPAYHHRNHYWQLSAEFQDTDGHAHVEHRMLFIALVQRRTLFLQSPQLNVLGRPHPTLMKLFDDILLEHGVTYLATVPPDYLGHKKEGSLSPYRRSTGALSQKKPRRSGAGGG